jgi:hypothetical protein
MRQEPMRMQESKTQAIVQTAQSRHGIKLSQLIARAAGLEPMPAG